MKRYLRVPRTCAAVAISGWLTACGQTAGPGWSPVVTIDGSVGGQLEVAGNEAGDAIAMWSHSEPEGWPTLRAARFTPEGGWQSMTNLGVGHGPQVALDAAGNAFAIWYDFAYVTTGNPFWSRYTAGAGWSNPVEIPGAVRATWGVAKNGDAMLAWSTEDAVYAQTFDSAGVLSPAEKVGSLSPSSGPQESVHVSQVLLDSHGNAVVAWHQARPSGKTSHSVLRCSRRVGGGAWLPEEQLDDLRGTLHGDDDGNVLTVWYDASQKTTRYARLTVADGWQPAQDVGTPSGFEPMSLAVNASGTGVLILSNKLDRLASVRFAPSTGWGSVSMLSDVSVGPNLFDVRAAIDSSGAALAVWAQASGGKAASVWTVPAAPWGLRQIVAGNDDRDALCPGEVFTRGARSPSVTVDASGAHSLVVWVDADCQESQVRASSKPAPRP
jgi:hypothetical protein